MFKKLDLTRIQVILLTLTFLICAVVFNIFELHMLPAQFIGALLGVVITAIITVLLLQGQSKTEESIEKNMKVFEKKQEVYFNFLEKLNAILQKEELQRHHNSKRNIEMEETNLQDLIFEFGFLKMHTSDKTFNNVLNHVLSLIQESNHLKFKEGIVVEDYKHYYLNLSKDFFAVVSLLKQELYSQEAELVQNETINKIIESSLKGY